MNSEAYTLHDYLAAAQVPKPAAFTKKLIMPWVPRGDQVVGLNRMLCNNRFGLFDDPGCGKTVMMQAKAVHMVTEGNKVLMLMPPVLLGQFVETMCETFPGIDSEISWHVLTQNPAGRAEVFELFDKTEWPDILLMSYEMFVLLTRIPKGQSKGRQEMAYKLRELYRVVECDEGHKLCGHDTLIHDTLSWHCGEPDESMLDIATGTPMPRDPLNAYGIIEMLNPTAYSDFRQFERAHAIYTRQKLPNPIKNSFGKMTEYVNKLTGFENQELIRANLYKYGRRVVKEQVLSLNEPTIQEVPVVLSNDHMRLYKRLEKERILEYEGEIIAGGINDQRLRQALLRIVTNPEVFAPKDANIDNQVLASTINLIESHGDAWPTEDGFPNKAIIFCNLRPTAAWLKKVFAEYGAEVLNGDTSDKEAVRKRFQNDPKCRVLIANPESAGYGLNFQHVSRLCIFIEPTSIPGDFKQAMERIYRNGQKGVCYVYILRASGTIAPRATKEMLGRMAEIDRVNRDAVALSTYFKRAA